MLPSCSGFMYTNPILLRSCSSSCYMKLILLLFCSLFPYTKPMLLFSCSLFCYEADSAAILLLIPIFYPHFKFGAGRVPLCGLNNRRVAFFYSVIPLRFSSLLCSSLPFYPDSFLYPSPLSSALFFSSLALLVSPLHALVLVSSLLFYSLLFTSLLFSSLPAPSI